MGPLQTFATCYIEVPVAVRDMRDVRNYSRVEYTERINTYPPFVTMKLTSYTQ